MVAKLWNDPLRPNIPLQQIQRFFNFRRVDVSFLTLQNCRFQNGEGFEGGHTRLEYHVSGVKLNIWQQKRNRTLPPKICRMRPWASRPIRVVSASLGVVCEDHPDKL